MSGEKHRRFVKDIQRGRRFEAEERAGWAHIPEEQIQFEANTQWKSKRGRIDIQIDDADGFVTIVEIKATDWDSLKPHRIRPTVLRHARQVWRYVNDFVDAQNTEVCPSIVYEYEPRSREFREAIEQELNVRGIQVVWRKESSPKIRFWEEVTGLAAPQ